MKNRILVLSGKGGVGKSTVATQLAFSLVEQGYKVGLLDVDLCGPSVPAMVGSNGAQIMQSAGGWLPVSVGEGEKKLSVMSIGFLLQDRDAAVVWRGPKKDAMIKQFVNDVVWGDLDFLVVDTPPGTSDEHITTVHALCKGTVYGADGTATESSDVPISDEKTVAVIVTTPQKASIIDVRKEISFCNKMKLPILGIVENMSGFVCPNCSECTEIFLKGGGQKLAEELNIPFLGALPLDNRVGSAAESGKSVISSQPETPAASIFKNIAEQIVKAVAPAGSS